MSSRCGTLNSRPRLCFVRPGRRQGRPGGVLQRRLERQRVRGLVVEPARHGLGIAQFPGEHPWPRVEIDRRAADQRVELLRQLVAVELRRRRPP